MAFCCRKMPAKYPAGRGLLANRVMKETRGGFDHDHDGDDEWSETCCSKYMHALLELVLDIWSAFAVFAKYALKFETCLSCCVSIASVFFFREFGEKLTANMSWTLVSFAVVFPLTLSITQGFRRRDDALAALSEVRGVLYNVMLAHMRWNWVGGTKEYNGRDIPTSKPYTNADGTAATDQWMLDQPNHIRRVYHLVSQLIDAMRQYLLVPRSGRARHVYTSCGVGEARWVGWAEEVGGLKVTRLLGLLHDATEELKRYGLPPNEASRINQFLFFLSRAWEKVRVLKEYRTPQAMRSFTRVFVHILPILYGPYFLAVSRGVNNDQDNVGFACVFASVMSVFMCSLLLVQTSLENPFDPKSLDTVKVDLEMGRTQRIIEALMEDLTVDWTDFEINMTMDPAEVQMAFVPSPRARKAHHQPDTAPMV